MGLIGLWAASNDVRAEDGAIRLGIVAPMSGPNSRYGSFSLRGAQLAAEEINDAGGIGGRKIAITSGDSQGTPVEGVSATRRLIDLDKVDFIIGDVSLLLGFADGAVESWFGVREKESDTLKPVLEAGLGKLGPVEMKPLIAQALHMGDECHNRNAAASALFFRRFVPAVLQADLPSDCLRESLNFLAGNDHFFLNLSMATCKAMLDAAHSVKGSSMVTAMARNGVRFGIRMSGTGDTWFEADALPVDGLYFPSYGPGDAARDLGDSAITETAGIGGFAMAAAPAIVQFVGGTPDDAIANTMSMPHVTFGRNNAFTLPPLNFGGTPAGIDARKVLDTNILPIINTGIAHKEAGVGQIGAGLTRAPLDCFAQAIKALVGRV